MRQKNICKKLNEYTNTLNKVLIWKTKKDKY